MQKILNQEEIDMLFRAAQKGQVPGGPVPAAKFNVSKFDIREVGQINKDQVRALTVLHENFARDITNSLGAYLRVGFEANIVSIEQLSYAEVVLRMPELTYLCSIRVRPLEVFALVHMDLALAFPIMDLILGGTGENDAIEMRDLTEIEEQIMESVVRILIRELRTCWAPVLDVEFEFEQRQPIAQAAMLVPATERNLAFSFEIKVLKSHGMLNLTLPAVVSNALLRKLSFQFAYYKRASSPAHMSQIRTQMLDGSFPVQLRLPPTPIRVADLTALQLGQILPLGHPPDQPAVLTVADEEMFLAYPVACGLLRGGQIQKRTSILPASRKAVP
jgi:flagellar motor switch protein FliM